LKHILDTLATIRGTLPNSMSVPDEKMLFLRDSTTLPVEHLFSD
jgi:hypothetical protein